MKRKWIYIFAALIVFGAIMAKVDPVKQKDVPSKAERAAAHAHEALLDRLDKQLSESETVIDVTPAELVRDYTRNEVAADRDYKGKWVRVHARFSSVEKDFTGDPYLVFAVGYVDRVHAYLYKYQFGEIDTDAKTFTAVPVIDKAAALQAGQPVTLECQGDGATLGMPRLKMCLVI